ncbi:adenylate/guanylate cyclase domain-containing protein [Marinilabilia salmonicolor]|jgi:class 3 adenylate cyclase/CheY-like chemotaxis protein|uniref:Class 3 adenylate cyclase n=1 Tax=Marinilabilia salmonicolor TaxID=989 RepID=A0A2T0XTM2_9BACT|nr:adenylate/guanylate cyclase domain-containing protein [Marinilabilia salmonicolor]PRZ02236.1 class 3 adenylate cyclase [Marinilabilia salmonicolor]RCW36191.1 class 3 adenylate cyclase [Marinilabilia salmonicolor]
MPSNKLTILIADDMDSIAEFIKAQLHTLSNDIDFQRARDGYETYRCALETSPDIILLDWEMPEISGMEALKNLKLNPKTQDIPVIIISSFSSSDKVKEALEAGAIDYVRKPIETDELIARVSSAMTLANTLRELKVQKQQLETEQKKTHHILKNILPAEIVKSLKSGVVIQPRPYRNVTIIMADLVNFTEKATRMSPRKLLDELRIIFTKFDEISQKHNCVRIKTIGDAYMGVSGMFSNSKEHALRAAKMACEMRDFIRDRNKQNGIQWELRIGLNSGEIIAGFISEHNLSYDIFGDNVNITARMQTYSGPMQINVSESTRKLLEPHYNFVRRVPQRVKGKGMIEMYYLHKPREDQSFNTKSINSNQHSPIT